MANQKVALDLKNIVELLNNKQFIADSRDYRDHYRAQSEKIGPSKTEWERQAPAFMSKFLDPFMAKWRGAHPLSDELLSSSLWQKKEIATMTGRWGVIPVYPWTTEKDVNRQTKQIQKAIGKQYTNPTAYRLTLIAKWLSDSYLSTRTHKPPKLRDIAAAVWERKKGLNRPSKAQAIANLSEGREVELMRAYIAKGKTRLEAERLIYQRVRGNESAAAAQVRTALGRLRKEQDNLKNVISDPQKTDTLGLAITMLLRELPASASSPQDLKAIRAKAVALGNLLLPPDSLA